MPAIVERLIERDVALVAQVVRAVAAGFRREDAVVELRHLTGVRVHLRERAREPLHRRRAFLRELRVVAVEQLRQLATALLHHGSRRAAAGRRREIVPRAPELIERVGHAGVGRLAEDTLQLAEQVAAHVGLTGLTGRRAIALVEQDVALANDRLDVDAGADDAVRQADRGVGDEHGFLTRIAGRLRVRDVLRDRLERRLVREERTARDAEQPAAHGQTVRLRRMPRGAPLTAGAGPSMAYVDVVAGAPTSVRTCWSLARQCLAQQLAIHPHLAGEQVGGLLEPLARLADAGVELLAELLLEIAQRAVLAAAQQHVELAPPLARLPERREHAMGRERGVVDALDVVGC